MQALENLHVDPVVFRGTERSGKCVSLISPDGERTMVTHLGAALELSAPEIGPELFDGYDCLYVEGYLVQNHELIRKAAATAKACGLQVAIDLASFNIVAENLEFLRELVRDYVDIVFANEEEAKTFTGEAEPLNALQMISEMTQLAVVKIGTKGALIKQGGEVVHVPGSADSRMTDTAVRLRCAPGAAPGRTPPAGMGWPHGSRPRPGPKESAHWRRPGRPGPPPHTAGRWPAPGWCFYNR